MMQLLGERRGVQDYYFFIDWVIYLRQLPDSEIGSCCASDEEHVR